MSNSNKSPTDPVISGNSGVKKDATVAAAAAAESTSDASESVPPSGYSTPLSLEPAKPLDPMQAKRFAYLLGQTDVFSHFIKDLIKDEALKAEINRQLESKSMKKNSEGESRRHRKTEKEEDAELLREDSPERVDEQQTFTESPTYVTGGSMRDYQLRGLNWMISLFENGINGILADEMGLGKTLQVISFIGYLKHFRNVQGPHLIVVPKSTLHNWKSEFNRWVPDLNIFLLHGDKHARAEIFETLLRPGNFNCCVTTYEMCLICKPELRKVSWEYIVVDEAHRLKNENSMLSKLVRMFSSQHRLLITGTPLQNNLHELWALLNFLLPDIFGSSEVFDEWFHKEEGDQEQIVQQLRKVLQPFLLRRIKSDVEHTLLPKKETNLYVGLSPMQRTWYRRILERDIVAINGAVGKKEGKTRLLNIVMQLRKCCNHPYLFDGAEPGPPYTTDEHLIYNAGKMAIMDKLLKRMKEQGSRVLIFSQMSRVLDILEDYCMFRGYKYCRLDGSTDHEDRVESINEFNRPDSDKFIFLLTTRAGGLGITLTAADIVCIYDSDWNPQADLQAMDRAHRIGQTKQVHVYRFITEDTVEEKVLERAMQKLRLDQLVIQQGRLAQASKGATHEQLLDMVQFGAENIFNSASNRGSTAGSRSGSGTGTPVPIDAGENGTAMSGIDIEDVLRRGESRTNELQSKYADMGLDDLNRFANESTSTTQWEGEDYARKRRAAEISQQWIQPAKRERKVNYAVDDYYREALRQSAKTSNPQRAPKPPKQINIHDFQFYPARLHELQEKEVLSYRRQIGYKIPKAGCDDEDYVEDLTTEGLEEEKRREEQAKIDQAEPLTEDEEKEKDELLEQGFGNWNRRDFYSFMRALESHGRGNMSMVKQDVEGKTPQEVEAYAKVFFKRYGELPEADRLTVQITRGEQRRVNRNEVQHLLEQKISECKQEPLRHLVVPYGSGGGSTSKGRVYTEDEDRFLLVHLARIGFGCDDVYDKIRQELRVSPLFRFDWFIKSRNSQEIQRRCQTLIGLLRKEVGTGQQTNGE